MKIKLSKTDIVETNDLSIAQLKYLLDMMAEKCDGMEVQLHQAKQKARVGEYSDPEWFRGLIVAKKKLGQARAQLVEEIALRKKTERMAENMQAELPKHFMKAAKARLSEAVYNAILEDASRRYGNTQRDGQGNPRYLFEGDV